MDVEGYQLDSGDTVTVDTSFKGEDSAGTEIDVVPQSITHTSTIEANAAVTPLEPATSGFKITPLVPSGPFQVRVDFDADLGKGVQTQSALFSGQIVGGIIKGINFVPRQPEPKEPPAGDEA